MECTSGTKTTRGFDCLNTKKPEHAPVFFVAEHLGLMQTAEIF